MLITTSCQQSESYVRKKNSFRDTRSNINRSERYLARELTK